MTIKNLFSILGMVIVVGAVSVFSVFAFTQSRLPDPDFSKVDLKHPDKNTVSTNYSWALKTLNGRDINLKDLCGTGLKVVFLNVWATWCDPCVEEMPSLQKLYDQMKHEVVFVFVSKENADTVSNFLEKNGYDLPVYSHDSYKVALPAEFKHFGIPTTFVIAPDGRIVFKQFGAVNWDTSQTVDFLREAKRLVQ